ncbi:MAG TPA: SDR family oxidoreductase [Acidimicrobiia bacterium]|nr:SDR family oxidoreductase [Acidimicrobiia bacterium]
MPDRDMDGKVVVITGGNTGIGKEAAVGLARAGATVVITSRNAERGEAALQDVQERSGRTDVSVMDLDLASFASIRRFATELLDRYDHLDVLLNNAGLVLSERTETEQGFETTFGVNHLGHFLLTQLLLDRLEANPGGARVVNVSSVAHKGARRGLDFDDLQSRRGYSAMNVYGKSKLANIYFTRELARRVGNGVTANAVHPGFVRSEFARGGDTGILYSVGVRLGAPFAISPEKGARTLVYLASSPEVDGVTGGYFYKCAPASISRAAQDDDAARRLWDVSEELIKSAA